MIANNVLQLMFIIAEIAYFCRGMKNLTRRLGVLLLKYKQLAKKEDKIMKRILYLLFVLVINVVV